MKVKSERDFPGKSTGMGCHCLLRETYITICKIDTQWEFAVWLREIKEGLCINLERWDGEEDGREFQTGGYICIPLADSC